MSPVAATAEQSPFAMADKIFPDTYFGETQPKEHHLPIFSEGDGLSFKDVIDTINPLQHLPVISAIYREITGDRPGAGARMVGAALYGGPIGLFGEVVNCAIDDSTGNDVGGHVVAFLGRQFSDPAPDGAPATMLAEAPAPIPAAAAAPAAAEPPAPVAAPQTAVVAEKTPEAAPSPTVTPTAAVAATPATSAAAPMAVNAAAGRFMPLPTRRAIDTVQPPIVRTPVSNSSQRSNVPITGRNLSSNIYSANAANAAAVQQALAAQGGGSNGLAALAGTAPAAGAGTPSPADASWFGSAMMQGLEKYERSARLNKPAQPQQSELQ